VTAKATNKRHHIKRCIIFSLLCLNIIIFFYTRVPGYKTWSIAHRQGFSDPVPGSVCYQVTLLKPDKTTA